MSYGGRAGSFLYDDKSAVELKRRPPSGLDEGQMLDNRNANPQINTA